MLLNFFSFFKIVKSVTVAEALKGKVVIEFPTFYVVLSRHLSKYPTDVSSPSKYLTRTSVY